MVEQENSSAVDIKEVQEKFKSSQKLAYIAVGSAITGFALEIIDLSIVGHYTVKPLMLETVLQLGPIVIFGICSVGCGKVSKWEYRDACRLMDDCKATTQNSPTLLE